MVLLVEKGRNALQAGKEVCFLTNLVSFSRIQSLPRVIRFVRMKVVSISAQQATVFGDPGSFSNNISDVGRCILRSKFEKANDFRRQRHKLAKGVSHVLDELSDEF